MKSIEFRIRSLAGIVQNDIEVPEEQIIEFVRESKEIRDDLKKLTKEISNFLRESDYIVHATVFKYDEGLEAETKSNVNSVFKAETKYEAKMKAIDHFIESHKHPKIKNIRIQVDSINKI